ADKIAGADDDHILALQDDFLLLKELHHPKGRARRKDRLAKDKSSHVVEVKPVDVLFDPDPPQHLLRIDIRRQRELDENPVDVGVVVQAIDEIKQGFRVGVLWKIVAE